MLYNTHQGQDWRGHLQGDDGHLQHPQCSRGHFETVLLSAEMRNPPWHDTIRNPWENIFCLVLRLGANSSPRPVSRRPTSRCPTSRPTKVSTPYTTEVSAHCFCRKYKRGFPVQDMRQAFHVSCLSHVVNVCEFVCQSCLSSIICFVWYCFPPPLLSLLGWLPTSRW